MGVESRSPNRETLSLSREERWTIHHIIVDRLERGSIACESAEIPPRDEALHGAFVTVDAGGTSFTEPELEALQSVLAEYQRSSDWWEIERGRIESALHEVAMHLDR